MADPTKIVIASTFTADPVSESIALWSETLGIALAVEMAPYDQLFQQLLDARGTFARNRGGTNVVLLRLEDWLGRHVSQVDDAGLERARRNALELVDALRASVARTQTLHALVLCPCSPRLVGNARLDELEAMLSSALAETALVVVVPTKALDDTYPVDRYFDADTDELGHVPYTPEMFAAIGTLVIRMHVMHRAPPYKVLVLDCDNTLWRGVVGEDGPMGVVVDEGHRALQTLAVAQQELGVLVCLCSKNNEADVWEVFEARTEMPLARAHIVASRIGWQPKSEGLQSLALELDLGLDSFVLLDDNAQEIAEVRLACPEALAIQVPSDSAALPGFLRQLWIFDRPPPTDEDRRRTAMYRENAARKHLHASSPSLETFLASLELEITIDALTPAHLARAAQLTERTNQFNTTSIRRTQSELAAVIAGGLEANIVTARDRFGDYGAVGLVMFGSWDDTLEVESFMLSCRVLGKGVETRIVQYLADVAQQRGLRAIALRYALTRKNAPARAFLDSLGAVVHDDRDRAVFVLSVDEALRLRPRTSPELPVERTSSGSASRLVARFGHAIETLSSPAEIARLCARRESRRGSDAYVPPRTAIERALAELVADALRVERVGLDDDFFLLGGHSLPALQLVARARSALGVELSTRALLDFPTIGALAAHVQSLAPASADKVPPPVPMPRSGALPLSLGQEVFWRPLRGPHPAPVGKMHQAIRFEGELALEHLDAAVSAIVERHEALRTVFALVDGVPTQRIEPPFAVHTKVRDLSELRGDEVRETLGELVQQELELGFDRERGPLFRCLLFRTAPLEHVFVVIIDQIASDAWSMEVFARELAHLYQAFSSGRPSPLPPLPVQIVDVALWQRRRLTPSALEAHRAYWRARLGDAPREIPLPLDRPRNGLNKSESLERVLAPERGTKLRTAAATQGGLFVALWTTLVSTLHALTGQRDLVIGTTHAGRNHAAVLDLIGAFGNVVALRTRLAGDETLRSLGARLRDELLETFEHVELPHSQVIDAIQPIRKPGMPALFNVSVQVHHEAPIRDQRVPRQSLVSLPLPRHPHAVDLYVHGDFSADRMSVRFAYNPHLFDRSTIERLADLFLDVLDRFVEIPDTPLARLHPVDATTRPRREVRP